MKIGDDTTKTARGMKYMCGTVMLLSLLGAPGCSAATAAGCGVGVLTGVALAGIAAASTKTDNAGTVMLGGGLFGVTSGCAAAGVADLIARPSAQERARLKNTEDAQQEYTPAPSYSRPATTTPKPRAQPAAAPPAALPPPAPTQAPGT